MHTTPPIDDLLRDQAARWAAGDQAAVEAYLERHPGLRNHPRLLDLVYNEVILRERDGDTPDLAEYARRFPDLVTELEIQWQIDGEFLAGGPTTLDRPPAAERPPGLPLIPGYQITDVLGRGGMGVVYRAVHTALGRPVALKMLRTDAAPGDPRVARFRAEAAAVARLRHPNIVQIYEVGEAAEQPFLALEFVDGGGLDRAVGGRPQVPRAAAGLVETLARAIHYAHQRGVIHRDLKPGNVLVTEGLLSGDRTEPAATLDPCLQTPKIADFGLAKLLDADPGLTATGQVVGTPAYMAPEQAAGRGDEVGVYTDVYALGAVLYELLTGRPPFRGDNAFDVAQRVLTEAPDPPRRVRADVPADLDVICRKCLEKESGRRYGSAEALADDLRRYLDGKPIVARPAGRAERAWRWARRNPAWAFTGTAVASLLIVMGMGGMALSARSDRARWDAEEARAEAEEARAEAVAEREKAEEELHKGRISTARANRFANQLGARADGLNLLQAAARYRVSPELRNEFIAALALTDVGLANQWPGWPETACSIAFAGDFSRYALMDTSETLVVYKVTDGAAAEVERLSGPGPAVGQVAMSPDGSVVGAKFAVRGKPGYELRFWRWDPARKAHVPGWTREGVNYHTAVVFRPDGRQVVLADEETGWIHVIDPAVPGDGTGFRIDPVGKDNWLSAATHSYHPRADRLAVARNGTVRIYDLSREKEESRFQVRDARMTIAVAWHPEGDKLLVGWRTPAGDRLGLFEADGRGPVETFDGHIGSGAYGGFDAKGRLVASNNWGDILRIHDARTGLPLFRQAAQTTHLRFAAMGDLLGADQLGGQVRLFRVRPAAEFWTLPVGKPEYDDSVRAQVDHDNRLLVVGNGDELSQWDLQTGMAVARESARGLPMGFERSGVLLTAGRDGLKALHVRRDWAAGTGTARWEVISDRHPLPQAGSVTRAVTASSNLDQVFVDFPRQLLRPTLYLRHRDVRNVLVSPDGRWVVSCAHFPTAGEAASVKVWDLKPRLSAELAAELRVGHPAHAAFSPDGKWLATATLNGGCRLWRVGTWEPGPVVGGNLPLFAPDGRTIVTESGHGELKVAAVADGRELARLASPFQTRMRPLCFSPDGGRLVAWGRETQAIHVWELAAIRAELRKHGLDWESP